MTYGRRVQIQQSEQHLTDNPRADRTEAAAAISDIGLAQHVVPERRVAVPSDLRGSDLVGAERLLADISRNCLAGGQTHTESAFETPNTQGVKSPNLAVTCPGNWKGDQ